jgi:hypothetical protein
MARKKQNKRVGGFAENRAFIDTNIRDEEIVFDDGKVWVLGQSSSFKGCTLICNVASSNFIPSATTLDHCEIIARVTMFMIPWTTVELIECTFKGRFSGCDFGPRPDLGREEARGTVIKCDFSQANLDACRFFNVDWRTLKFPAWPCFTIIDHDAAAIDFSRSRISTKAKAKDYAEISIGEPEEGEVALCLIAAEEAKVLGCPEIRLKEFLTGKPYVLF